MRVLHFYKTALPDSMGGTQQVIDQIARGSVKFGVQTDVLSLTSNNSEEIISINGYQAHRVRQNFQVASTGFSLNAFGRFEQLAESADIIHYHFPWPFMDLVHFFTRPSKPSVVTYHSDIVKQKWLLRLYTPLQNKFLSSVTQIVATSPNYVASSPVLKQLTAKTKIIPIGIDKASYPKVEQDRVDYWRQKFGEQFFLFVGVLRYYKGLDSLIKAAVSTNCLIVIAGSGPLEQDLRKRVTQLGLKNVQLIGQVSEQDKVALLTLCYGVVFPSHLRSEAFGISLLEGAMFGKPLISCEIGTGTTFINIDGETGIAIPPNDDKELGKAMQYLLDNPERASVMGKASERRYWEFFTAELMINSYVDLYSNLINLNKS